MLENSPFREEDLRKGHNRAENSSGENHFKLHIAPAFQPTVAGSHTAAIHIPVHHDSSHPQAHHHVKNAQQQQKTHISEGKRNFKGILEDAGRQLLASFIILVIGFLALNWSAYYKIAKNEWQKFSGSRVESPLAQLIEKQPVIYSRQDMVTNSDPAIQKRQIPELNLEIAPYDNRLIIPRIDQNIPIVNVSSESLIKRDWDGLEKEMQSALKGGVVHYPGTSLPGQTGNVVITGHSSYFPWDPGRFKDVFALLHDVVQGDKIAIYYNQDKYLYEVDNIKIVLPEDIEVLKQTTEDRVTLITCTPVGTNLKRLIVSAKLIAKNGQPIGS